MAWNLGGEKFEEKISLPCPFNPMCYAGKKDHKKPSILYPGRAFIKKTRASWF
jgi:hypothetical protein